MLEAAGSSIDNCVQVKIFLTDMANFAAMNTVYAEVFHKEPKPVRTWYVFPVHEVEGHPGQARRFADLGVWSLWRKHQC